VGKGFLNGQIRMIGKMVFALRKFFVLILCMPLVFAGNIASVRADEPDLEYVECSSGGYITIQDSILVSSDSCAGSVQVPLYVTAIDNLVFFSATQLFEIKFDQNSALETIGAGAFQSSGLTQITIPSSVTSIGSDAFAETAALVNVSFDSNSSLQTIGSEAFLRSALNEITIPSNVTSIEERAFAETADLLFLAFSSDSTLETIGAGAFQSSGLTDITIPASVTSIGSQAFADSGNLAKIVFMGDAPILGEDAFSGISADAIAYVMSEATGFDSGAWSAIQIKNAGKIFCSTSGYALVVNDAIRNDVACQGDLEIPNNVVAILKGAFSDSTYLQSVSFSEDSNLSVIEPFAFADSSLSSITIPSSTTLIMESAFENTKKLRSFAIDSDSKLESIGDGAFRGSKIVEIYIPATVTYIGDQAFANTTSLSVVSFGWGIQLPIISSGTFQDASALPFINVPPSVTSIGASAFSGSGLFSLSIPNSVLSIGDQAFSNITNLSDVSFNPSSKLTSIGKGVLQDTTGLTSIDIPPSVISIGDSAFSGSGLTSLSIPATVTTIGEQAFSNTADLTEVTFGDGSSLSSIGPNAFSGSGITLIAIPAGLTSLGERAFADVANLAEVRFDPDSRLRSIGPNAFSGTALESIIIPASVTSIGEAAFANVSDLLEVTFDAGLNEAGSALESIGAGAFSGTGLSEITIPANVNSIGDQAFANVPFLATFTVVSENENFESDSGVLFNAGKTKLIQYPLGRESDPESNINLYSVPNSVAEIGSYAFSGSHDGTNVEFTNDSALEIIGSNAFSGSAISQIAIPASVISIGEQAFANTPNLQSVTMPPNLALDKIENSVFENSAISTLNIPGSVASIGNSAFKGSGLTEIIIPASVTSIGEQAFANTLNLRSVRFAQGTNIERIESAAFASSAITSIIIPDGVVTIGASAFQDASELTEVTVPNSVSLIGVNAFSATTALQRIYFLGDAPDSQSNFDETSQAVAYKTATAQGFTPRWNGIVANNGIFTVTFNSQDGTAVASKTLLFGKSIAIAPANPTRAAYTFLGWSESVDGVAIRFPYTPSVYGDKILYAKWSSNKARLDLTKARPSISGKVISNKAGTNKLTAKPGSWIGVPPPVITYAWYSCKTQVKVLTTTIPNSCKPIPKATKVTLPVVSSYKGKFLAVKVTGTSAGTASTFYLAPSSTKVK